MPPNSHAPQRPNGPGWWTIVRALATGPLAAGLLGAGLFAAVVLALTVVSLFVVRSATRL